MEVIIFMIVLCFLFSSQKKKSQKVGKKETPVQNRPVTDYRPQTQSRQILDSGRKQRATFYPTERIK